jgi:hypothetical protein
MHLGLCEDHSCRGDIWVIPLYVAVHGHWVGLGWFSTIDYLISL